MAYHITRPESRGGERDLLLQAPATFIRLGQLPLKDICYSGLGLRWTNTVRRQTVADKRTSRCSHDLILPRIGSVGHPPRAVGFPLLRSPVAMPARNG